MGAKRGESGLSLIVGIDKPQGLSSHDVVNACRRIFGERRVGHTGTLDPMATGVLPICIGPATRLDSYLVGHDKAYAARIAFGASTDTDDATGTVVSYAVPPIWAYDNRFAQDILSNFVGELKQSPPAYSAIKVEGRKAYDAARSGKPLELKARDITVQYADLTGISRDEESGLLTWDVVFGVSAGTYVRALARDIGKAFNCPAHLFSLRRLRVGSLEVGDCHTLEELERIGCAATLDPVPMLGFRLAFAKGEAKDRISNGNPLPASSLELFTVPRMGFEERVGSCSSSLNPSAEQPYEGERICVIADGLLAAIYRYEGHKDRYIADTVFSQGVSRG